MSADSSKSDNKPPFQAQLFRDIEAHSSLSCKEICNQRPEVYGTTSSSIRRAVQNKFRYLKELKKSRPDQYWKQYARATAPAISFNSQNQVELNQDDEEEEQEPPWSSPVRQEDQSEKPAARSRHASWQSPKPSFQNQEESPSHHSFESDSSLNMSYRSPPSGRMNRVARESPHQIRNMFETVTEAEEYGKYTVKKFIHFYFLHRHARCFSYMTSYLIVYPSAS
jgi:hypothetical protein